MNKLDNENDQLIKNLLKGPNITYQANDPKVEWEKVSGRIKAYKRNIKILNGSIFASLLLIFSLYISSPRTNVADDISSYIVQDSYFDYEVDESLINEEFLEIVTEESA